MIYKRDAFCVKDFKLFDIKNMNYPTVPIDQVKV